MVSIIIPLMALAKAATGRREPLPVLKVRVPPAKTIPPQLVPPVQIIPRGPLVSEPSIGPKIIPTSAGVVTAPVQRLNAVAPPRPPPSFATSEVARQLVARQTFARMHPYLIPPLGVGGKPSTV